MTENRVLILGRAGMDFYADPPGTPVEAATRFSAALGGSSANLAAGLGRQGVASAILTVLSDDAVGRFCTRALEGYGVDTGLVRYVGGDPRTSLAVVDTRGAATQAVIYRNNASDFLLTPEDVSRADMSGFRALATTGTALAEEPSRGATLAALRAARAAGAEAVLDLDYRPYSWASAAEAGAVYRDAAALCDIVVGNDDEFEVFADAPGGGLAAARTLAAGGRVVIYKMGHLGSRTLSADGAFSTGVFSVEALKPTGAGDAFLAGFLGSRLSGAPLETAVVRGSAAAAIVVTRVGCAPAMPTAGEIDRFIAEHPGLSPGPED